MDQKQIEDLGTARSKVEYARDLYKNAENAYSVLVRRCDHKWPDGKGSISQDANNEDGGVSFTCDICGESWYLDD